MKLGIATSVYRDEGYDFLKTLKLAAGMHPSYPDFKADVVQLYLNPESIRNKQLLRQTRDFARKQNIELITHVHTIPLEDKNESYLEDIAKAHSIILKYQKYKRAVVHYENFLETSLLVQALDKLKITPYVENFHKGVIDQEERKKHDAFVRYIRSAKRDYEIGAVLDFGRYFVMDQKSAEDQENIKKAIGVIGSAYQSFSDKNIPVFFHTIGTRTHQQERADWVAPGAGDDVIPQKFLSSALCYGDVGGLLIIESEKVEHAVAGINYFRSLIAEWTH